MNAAAKLRKAYETRERSLAIARQVRPDLVRLLLDVQTKINVPLNGMGIRFVKAAIALVLLELEIEDIEAKLVPVAPDAPAEPPGTDPPAPAVDPS